MKSAHLRRCLPALLLTTSIFGCEPGATRQVVRYPDGALQVRYESASDHRSCLVASVAMTANYVLGEWELSEKRIRTELKQLGLDETVVGDLKAYLKRKQLDMMVLRGEMGAEPPTGLAFWVGSRRYPVICIINQNDEGDPAYNHAVVVIGIDADPESRSADMIHYFDPSTEQVHLHSRPADEFEKIWARGGYAMMIVVVPPE